MQKTKRNRRQVWNDILVMSNPNTKEIYMKIRCKNYFFRQKYNMQKDLLEISFEANKANSAFPILGEPKVKSWTTSAGNMPSWITLIAIRVARAPPAYNNQNYNMMKHPS